MKTGILFTHSNFKGFEGNFNTLFEYLDNLFERNLSLNWKKKKKNQFVKNLSICKLVMITK
jgi:hypothetical protein